MDAVPEKPIQPRTLVWLVDSLDRCRAFRPQFATSSASRCTRPKSGSGMKREDSARLC
jgi:hypothetical protein